MSNSYNFNGTTTIGGLGDNWRIKELNQTNYTDEQKESLAEAAAEIQKLLDQLTQNNQTNDEQVTKAIHDEIKNNPTLKARLKSALKAGRLEALKAIFNHPLFNIPTETLKGFIESE